MDKDEVMAIRFSWTEKYDDLWYRKLPILGKQLYDYLWHKCDIAGLWEIDLEKAAFDIGADTGAIQGALKGLEIKYKSLSGGKIWLVNFLKCQKNLPLNPKNAAHASIINRLLPYAETSEIFELINTPETEGLTRGFKAPIVIVISNSKGKSKGNIAYAENFETFWQKYPRRDGKGKAFEAWRQINPDTELCAKISIAADGMARRAEKGEFKDTKEPEKYPLKFCPLPATWLNQRRFDDPAEQPRQVKREITCCICGKPITGSVVNAQNGKAHNECYFQKAKR